MFNVIPNPQFPPAAATLPMTIWISQSEMSLSVFCNHIQAHYDFLVIALASEADDRWPVVTLCCAAILR
jgi:hypothetical protein